MAVKIQLRRGTTSQWTSDIVLFAGEIGVNTETKQIKVGDGSTTWGALPYFASGTITSVNAGTGITTYSTGGGSASSGAVSVAVDTTYVMARNIINAKGDIIVGLSDDTPAALPVGLVNNYPLVVNSGAQAGVSWGQIVEAAIATSAVTTAKIADNSITTAKILNSSVTDVKIATNAVTTAKILDANVTTAKIANDAVTSTKIATGAVGSDELATDAVTSAKIATGAVGYDELANNTVTNEKIANSTISAGKLDTLYCQAGTGSGQSGNIVKIGWSPQSNLRVQVDATDFGATWPINITGSSTSVAGQTSAATANSVAVRGSNGSINASAISCGGLTYASSGAGFFGNTTTNGDGVVRTGAYDNSATAITTNQVTGNYHMAFYFNGSNIGSVYGTTSNCSFNTTSDYRLKENVIPLANSLSIIEKIKPRSFNFIAEPNKTYDGFIAHELAKVVPYAVTGEKDAVDEQGGIKPQQVDYSKLVAVLVGAVQELSARVKELENNK